MKSSVLFIVLGLSVLLNAFLAGQLTKYAHPPHVNHFLAAEERLAHAVPALPPPHRDMIQALLDKHRAESKTEYDHMHDLFTQIRDTLTAPKFDAAKLARLREKIEIGDKKLKTSYIALIDKIAADLPDNERARFFSAAMPPDR